MAGVANQTAEAESRRRRPKDRADQILAAATELFAQRGFDAVGIDEIGAAVGISGPSVYRHYASKEALLVASAERFLEGFPSIYREALVAVSVPADRVAALVRPTIRSMIQQRQLFSVMLRDGRRLPPRMARQLIAKRSEVARIWIEELQSLFPDLPAEIALFNADTVAAMTLSVLHLPPSVPMTRAEDILSTMATRALLAPPPPLDSTVAATADRRQAFATMHLREQELTDSRRGSRREQILNLAIRLFRERGYGGISIEDVGAAAGISGPAVYKHFRRKEDILYAALNRASEWLAVSARAADAFADPADALRARIASYVDACVAHPDLVALYWLEYRSLSGDNDAMFKRAHRAYMDEWAGLLLSAHPGVGDLDARIMSYGVLHLLNGYWTGAIELTPSAARTLLCHLAGCAADLPPAA